MSYRYRIEIEKVTSKHHYFGLHCTLATRPPGL